MFVLCFKIAPKLFQKCSKIDLKIAPKMFKKCSKIDPEIAPKWARNGSWRAPGGVRNLFGRPFASWRALGALLEGSRAEKKCSERALDGS